MWKGPFVSLTVTKVSISLSSLWDSWGLSRSVSRRECWLETRSPFQHSRNGQDVAWLQLKLTLTNRRNKRNHQIIIVTFSVLAYRKFLRFDYIIKGRKCDWFESIHPVLACVTGALRAKWGERVIFSLPRSPTLHARFALRAKCRVRLAWLMKRSLCRLFQWYSDTERFLFFSMKRKRTPYHFKCGMCENKTCFTAGVTWRRGSWERELSHLRSALHNTPILWLPQIRCNMSRVLVTGASGYLAMHVVKQLVDSGEYIVRGTVRSLTNETKVKPLKELSSENDKYPLELVEADLTKKETWVEWVI